jgi:hypothetical protein
MAEFTYGLRHKTSPRKLRQVMPVIRAQSILNMYLCIAFQITIVSLEMWIRYTGPIVVTEQKFIGLKYSFNFIHILYIMVYYW